MPNTIPAAAEGLPQINRRNALTVTGSGIVAALTGLAACHPVPAAAAISEDISVKVRRLSRELSIALDEWTSDMGTDQWVAHIHPYSSREYPVSFENVTATASAREAYARHKAEEALRATYDTPAMRLFRKWRRAYEAGEKAPNNAEQSRLIIKASRYENRLVATPISSPVEYAAKVLAVTGFGNFGFGDHEARLVAEAIQLVGEG